MNALARAGKLPAAMTLGIRPFYVGMSSAQDAKHTIPASIFVVEPLGDSTVVTVEVADARMQVVAEPGFKGETKESVWLSFEPDRILLFEDAGGKTVTNGTTAS
jgi:multiple sugar transport system ATP-binding protein